MSYLKNDIVLEPLVYRWYAWSQLLSPQTLALNLKNRVFPMLNSYVKSPALHALAQKNKTLSGGMILEPQPSCNMEDYLINLNDSASCWIELADGLQALHKLILTLDGKPLEKMYDEIPGCLKGLVELLYTESNYPLVRLLEPLLFQDYSTSLQESQSIQLKRVLNDEREFSLSTPRISSQNTITISIPFKDSRIDALMRAREHNTDIHEIAAQFEISSDQLNLFESFFHNEPQMNKEKFSTTKDSFKYFGHASLLISTMSGHSILVDPIIPTTNADDSQPARYSFENLPNSIDYVLLTHNHHDHISIETLLALRYKIKNIIVPRNLGCSYCDPSLKLMLQHIGFNNILEVDEFQKIHDGNITISSLPFFGEHADLAIGAKRCYKIDTGDTTAFFAADYDAFDEKLIKKVVNFSGKTDILFIGTECEGAPMSWVYGPLLNISASAQMHNTSRRLKGSDAKKVCFLAQQLQAKAVYIYALGQEPWLGHIMRFNGKHPLGDSNQIAEAKKAVDLCIAKGIKCEILFGKKEITL